MTSDSGRIDERVILRNDAIGLLANPAARHAAFAALMLCSVAAMWTVLKNLAQLSLDSELYSQILVIPFVSALLIYLRKSTVFAHPRWQPAPAAPLFILGAALYFAAGRFIFFGPDEGLALRVLGSLLVWVAAFLLCYGWPALRGACFPVSLLLFLIPLPGGLLAAATVFLQKSSADVSEVLFKVAGVPLFRQGFQFVLPGLTIEIAQECSGIHSCIAFAITGLVTANLALKSLWQRTVICLLIVPIAIFKNAVRIVTLAWLGLHVNRDILFGPLHKKGGLVFSVVNIALLFTALVILRRSDHWLTFWGARFRILRPSRAS